MNVILNSGRRIALVNLRQWKTYYGHLAGIPTAAMNASLVREALKEAARVGVVDGTPFLISPPVATRQRMSGGVPMMEERMPATACIGTFDSSELAKPGSEPYSSAVIVWFQDDFGPPVSGDVLEALRQLDWEAVARDWIW